MPKSLVLIGISGSRVGQQTVFASRSNVVGSELGCDVVLHDRLVLPRHVELRVALDRWFVVPLDPKATIFVNGQRVTGQQRVDEGDLVTLGTATFKAALVDNASERQVGGTSRW